MKAIISYVLGVALLLPVLAFAVEPTPILSNGGFEVDANGDGWPDEWPRPDGTTWEKDEKGGRYVHVVAKGKDVMVTLYRKIELPADARALRLRFRIRTTDVVPGAEKWNDARVIMHVKDKDGKELQPEPPSIRYVGSTEGWVDSDTTFNLPAGTVTIEFIPAMFNATSGSFDLDDVTLVPAEVVAPDKSDAEGRPMVEPVPLTTDVRSGPMPSSIHVQNDELHDAQNHAMWLQGVTVPSLERRPDGEGVLQSIRVATGVWKANVILLPVSDRFWFGRGDGQQADGAQQYRALVDAAVHLAANADAYTVIDLHHDGAPDESVKAFWADVAARYKDHPAVLFGLYNMPKEGSWISWREDNQGLIDVVRSAGANNVLVIDGLGRVDGIKGLDDGDPLHDRAGAGGIIYDVHLNPSMHDYEHQFLRFAPKYPLLVSGGWDRPESSSSLPVGKTIEDPYRWSPATIAMIQKYRLHWIAGSLHPQANPSLVQNWNYDPTPEWGAFVRMALAGGRFN